MRATTRTYQRGHSPAFLLPLRFVVIRRVEINSAKQFYDFTLFAFPYVLIERCSNCLFFGFVWTYSSGLFNQRIIKCQIRSHACVSYHTSDCVTSAKQKPGALSPVLVNKLLLIHFHPIADVDWLEREDDHASGGGWRGPDDHDLAHCLAWHLGNVHFGAVRAIHETGH
jgi:hypothetical protein